MGNSTLFSNHGHVLLVLADDPEARLRDVAARIGITERAVQKIVRDLQDDGLVTVSKHGRRNRYRINTRKTLRHPLEASRTVGALIGLMKGGAVVSVSRAEQGPGAGTAVVEADSESAGNDPPAEQRGKPREAPGKSARQAEDASAPAQPREPEAAVAEAPQPGPAPAKPKAAEKPSRQARKKSARGEPGPDDQQGSLF